MIGLVLLAGCQFPVVISNQVESSPHSVGCAGADCGDSAHSISVTYLGVSGLLIQHDGHVVLTAPFFSNPSFAMVRPRLSRLLRSSPRISADTAAIEKLLPRSADRSSAILVGHGHYDHLMDVPYISRKRATAATIYSGPSVRHMLMGDSALRAAGAPRLVSIPTSDAGTWDRRGVWYYTGDSAYRFMALLATHAPTYRAWRKSYTFTAGTIAVDLDSLPHTAAEWKLGEPYAYVIDVLSSTRSPVFRIYFQDAPSEPPLGFPPRDLLAERGVDLAVLCAATSSNVALVADTISLPGNGKTYGVFTVDGGGGDEETAGTSSALRAASRLPFLRWASASLMESSRIRSGWRACFLARS